MAVYQKTDGLYLKCEDCGEVFSSDWDSARSVLFFAFYHECGVGFNGRVVQNTTLEEAKERAYTRPFTILLEEDAI